MSDKKLRPKYLVFKIKPDGDTEEHGMDSTDPENVDSPFVLMPRKDPAALYALMSYTETCEPDLALEIREWAETIVKATPSYGSQGERNRVHMKLKQLRLFS